MKNLLRLLISLLMLLAMLVLVGCSGGAPGCPQVGFGSSSCSSSSSGGTGFGGGGGGGGNGGGGGGGNGTTPAAFAYYVDQIGTMDGFEIDTTSGSFEAIPSYTPPAIPGADLSIGVVVAQKKFLYTGFWTQNELFAWSIDGAGTLTAVSGSPYSVAYLGFIGFSGYNQMDIITNPAGTLLFISDAGNGEIWVYQIGNDGSLTAATGSPFSTSGYSQPWNMTTDGLGKYLYVTEAIGLHEGVNVTAYSISSTGTLTVVPGSPFAYPMWQVQGESTGQYLIGISGKTTSIAGTDDDNIYVFNIQQTGANAGAISPVTGSPFATTYPPFNIAVQPNATNGEFVYSFSMNSTGLVYNPVEGYSLNTSTGALTAAVNSPFSGVTATIWGQFDQNGSYLFNYGDITGPVLGVYNVTAGTGALTQSMSTVPEGTTGYWAVTDVQ
jgi:6-phosphogluconolactonase (cycloisomerase 2 family)